MTHFGFPVWTKCIPACVAFKLINVIGSCQNLIEKKLENNILYKRVRCSREPRGGTVAHQGLTKVFIWFPFFVNSVHLFDTNFANIFFFFFLNSFSPQSLEFRSQYNPFDIFNRCLKFKLLNFWIFWQLHSLRCITKFGLPKNVLALNAL